MDRDELVELNKRFDNCVEAISAKDVGDYWIVQSASNHRTYYVKKNLNEGGK